MTAGGATLGMVCAGPTLCLKQSAPLMSLGPDGSRQEAVPEVECQARGQQARHGRQHRHAQPEHRAPREPAAARLALLVQVAQLHAQGAFSRASCRDGLSGCLND